MGASAHAGRALSADELVPDLTGGFRGALLRRQWRTMVIVAILTTAAAFRLCNLGYNSLPENEVWRANFSYNGGLAEARRFPPFQYVMLWTLQHVVGRTEFVLRLPCALAGVLCVLVLYQFARRHLNYGSALVVATLAACHPVLVLHSRSLKVFSFEALMTSVLLWAGLEAYQRRSSRHLWLFLAAGLLGLGFTFTSSLLIGAWMPVLAWASFRGDGTTHRPLRTFLSVATLLALAGAGWYVWLSGCPYRQGLIVYFGSQENMWPAAYTAAALARWLFVSGHGAVQYVLGISADWPPWSWCIATLELLAMAASIGMLWQRCRPLCVAMMLLAAEVVLAGAFHMWPLGKIRTTTFLVPIALISIGCGSFELARRVGRSPAMVLGMALCLLVPMARAGKSTVLSPPLNEHMRPVLEYVESHLERDDAVFVYYSARFAFEYYCRLDESLQLMPSGRVVQVRWQSTDVPALVQPPSDRDNLTCFANRFDTWMAQHPRVWFVFSHNWKNEREEWIGYLEGKHVRIDKLEIGGASAHLFTRTSPPSVSNSSDWSR